MSWEWILCNLKIQNREDKKNVKIYKTSVQILFNYKEFSKMIKNYDKQENQKNKSFMMIVIPSQQLWL